MICTYGAWELIKGKSERRCVDIIRREYTPALSGPVTMGLHVHAHVHVFIHVHVLVHVIVCAGVSISIHIHVYYIHTLQLLNLV